jgi:glycosyltransferase involved in cell wall biosynthesis
VTGIRPPQRDRDAGNGGAGIGGLVLIVTPGGLSEQGGMGRIVSNITRHWRATGSGPRYRVIDPWGPRLLPLAPFYLARALAQVAWHALREPVALLHIHMAARGSVVRKALVLLLGKALGIPVLLHLHAGNFEAFFRGLPPVGRRLLHGLLRRADGIVVLGRPWQHMLVDDLGLDAARVTVLPNAVPAPAHAPRQDTSGKGGGTCRLVFLGRLEDRKGVPELLDALADPRLAALDWHATLAGGGELRRFRQRIAALGLTARVDCPGWQSEDAVRRLLGDADVFVLPSHHEGLSMALLEALAEGLAIVTTPVGATPEVIEDGRSGLLVPPGDREALAEALARLIEDRALRSSLRAGARRSFNEKFDISVYCRNLEQLYRRLVAAPART